MNNFRAEVHQILRDATSLAAEQRLTVAEMEAVTDSLVALFAKDLCEGTNEDLLRAELVKVGRAAKMLGRAEGYHQSASRLGAPSAIGIGDKRVEYVDAEVDLFTRLYDIERKHGAAPLAAAENAGAAFAAFPRREVIGG